MKHILLIFSILFLNFTFSQCPVKLNEFLLMKNSTVSEFDTFALKNGYSYNSNSNMYMCDDKINNNPNDSYNILYRIVKDDKITIGYTFMDKDEYLSKKTLLTENLELIQTNNIDNGLQFVYKTKNNDIILLMTQTTLYNNKNQNVYVLIH
jgi:hypothetical protein